MSTDATITVAELENKFEKKLTEKDTLIKTLEAKLDEFNKSSVKATLDAKDIEITSLKADLTKLTESEKAARVLA